MRCALTYRRTQDVRKLSLKTSLSQKTFHLSWEVQREPPFGPSESPFCRHDGFLSGEPSRAPFQMAFCWGSSALRFNEFFPRLAKLNLFGEISRSECSPASLGPSWNGRSMAPCPWSGEHLEKASVSVQSTAAWSLLCLSCP